MPDGTVALRICQEGHANALALNKDSTQIAVAGRSRKSPEISNAWSMEIQ